MEYLTETQQSNLPSKEVILNSISLGLDIAKGIKWLNDKGHVINGLNWWQIVVIVSSGGDISAQIADFSETKLLNSGGNFNNFLLSFCGY